MPRRPRMLVSLLAAAVVATAGCTLPVIAPEGADPAGPEPGSNAPAVPGTRAAWRPCPEIPRELVGQGATTMTYDCASVAVPRDWAQPRGETYDIAMIRIRSRDQKNRIGSLVLNPGGPGASGIDTAVYLSYGERLGGLPTAVTDRFDIVGFDPRGVSRSAPVECIGNEEQDESFALAPDPDTQAEFDAAVALNREITEECARKYGDDLVTYSTEQTARDMDAIRAAVGDEQLTYLGYSYGTLLGATYAQLFPKRIRALVLDGAIDPRQDFIAGSEAQARGFERAFTNFTNWCRGNASQCPIAPDARRAVTDALAKAETSPIRGRDGRDATAGWIFVAVVSSLYTEPGWMSLARAVDNLRDGDPEAIFNLADQYADREDNGTYSNLFDANLAVNCTDAENVPTLDRIRALQGEWRTKYPLFGAPLAVGMVPCAVWPGKRDPYPTGPATGAPPILVVGTTGDPATPYENTEALARMLGTGQVLTWEGEGHTAYPSTPCIKNAVNAYLIEGTMPRAGLRCPAR